MGCALGAVRVVKGHVTGLEVSPTGRCSLLEELRINSQSSGHLELATQEIWRAGACFGGAGNEFDIIGMQLMVYRQVIG